MEETKDEDPALNVLEKKISLDVAEEVLEKTSETIEDEDVLEELPSQEIEDGELRNFFCRGENFICATFSRRRIFRVSRGGRRNGRRRRRSELR